VECDLVMNGSPGWWRGGGVKRKKEETGRMGRGQGLFRSTLSLIFLTSLASVVMTAMFGVCKVLPRLYSPFPRR